MIYLSFRKVKALALLLDEIIPQQIGHYQGEVAAGRGTPQLHVNVHGSQCPAWISELQAALADTTLLATFQARYPDWTTQRIEGVVASLQAIRAAAQQMTGATVASASGALGSVLSSNLS
ncbi:MAG: hypothetical protein KGL39_49685 [Patescibacteria group bacterium]|nr:hypothetical protein [Patescibacteria group bacterium]